MPWKKWTKREFSFSNLTKCPIFQVKTFQLQEIFLDHSLLLLWEFPHSDLLELYNHLLWLPVGRRITKGKELRFAFSNSGIMHLHNYNYFSHLFGFCNLPFIKTVTTTSIITIFIASPSPPQDWIEILIEI